MNVTQPRRTRHTHSEAFKRSLIEACGEPDASVAGVALANGINANQLRCWMRERGIEQPELSCLPLRLAASEPVGGFIPVPLPSSQDAPIRLEMRKGAAVVTVEWPASSAAAFGVWLREWLGWHRHRQGRAGAHPHQQPAAGQDPLQRGPHCSRGAEADRHGRKRARQPGSARNRLVNEKEATA